MSELRPRAARSRRAAGIARHGRLRKSNGWLTGFKLLAATLAVVLVSGASVGAIATWQLTSQIKTEAIGFDKKEGPPPSIGAIEGGFNILIVGSDQCETAPEDCGARGSAKLNDVNMLLHVSQDQTNATAISFPRDMVVGIPRCEWGPDWEREGTKVFSTEPINTALYYGGLACVAMTVEELTGLDIHFAGLITFGGVVQMTNAIGGVPVCVNGPVIDKYSGINLPAAGTYELSGKTALAFLRSRKGVGDGSDITRISSQQVYLSSLVRTLKSDETLGDFTKLYGLAQAASSTMVLSEGLRNPDTMISIALALKDIPLERVTFVQYPGTTGGTGVYEGKVKPLERAGEELMAQIKSDQPFVLEEAGDGRGSEANPDAPTSDATPGPSASPVDNSGLPVISNVRGQTAADYTCSIAN